MSTHEKFEALRRANPRPVAGFAQTSHGDTRVHWISGARVVVLD